MNNDLYSRQPLIESALEADFNYFFACKYTSRKHLKEWIDPCDSQKNLTEFTKKFRRGKKSKTHTYRFRNNVPLHGGKNSIEVNWVKLVIKNDIGKTTQLQQAMLKVL